MSKARSIKTDLEQYLTELDKQYGNNKVSIKIPITATDPVISPLKKPVKELIADANPELYQTELDKQYGNALPAADSNPAVKKTAKEMIAEANPELYQTITNTEQIAKANPEASSGAKSAYHHLPPLTFPSQTDLDAIKYLPGQDDFVGPTITEQQTIYGENPYAQPVQAVTADGEMPTQPAKTYGPIEKAVVNQTSVTGVDRTNPVSKQIYGAKRDVQQVQAPGSTEGSTTSASTYGESVDVKQTQAPGYNEGVPPAEPEAKKTEAESASSDVKDYKRWLVEDYYEAQKQVQKKAAEEQYQITAEAAQNQYDQAMYGAAVAEQKAINDAQNAYALRRATYGAQGESLGRNGLAMSGYSDYADQAAYAASRGEIAGAGAVRAGTEQQALSDYQNYLLNAKLAEKQASYGADYEYLQNMGNLQKARDELQAKYEAELAEQQQKVDASVYAAQTEYFDNIRSELMDDPDAYSVEQIQDFVKAGYLSSDMGTALVNWKNSYDASIEKFYASVESYLDSLAQSGDVNDQLRKFREAVDDEYADNPDVQKKLYEKLMLRYAKNADESNYDQILEAIKEYKNEGKLSAIAAQNVEAEMNKTMARKMQVVGELKTVGSDGNPLTGGKMIMAKTNDGETISHGYKDIVTSEAGKQTAALLDKFTSGDSNKVFSYNNHYYAKIDGKWRLLKKSIYSEK